MRRNPESRLAFSETIFRSLFPFTFPALSRTHTACAAHQFNEKGAPT